ncbi:aryl-sulfate sulfotransferase [Campylobacter suis]|uniref:Arylsulfate sulfotransferase AssT n=1 Tax=Campylobacter suis TaxID=2790657 RepID=A0ABM8Q903_9BACT|nr:aryl-sulfate sulfotransferase [Campylobacter suis]CAD7289297.1 Arylsulfate sulfotransferase AssT [Campylobacter suis]
MKSKFLTSVLVAGTLLSVGTTSALALGGPSGAALDYPVAGKLGGVHMDPYGLSPLSAVIMDGGYVIENAKVTIQPKKGGVALSYKVGIQNLRTYGGIPVVGLYANYNNTVDVEYTRVHNGKKEQIKESYKIYTSPYSQISTGRSAGPYSEVKVHKVDPEFKDRMYLVNNVVGKAAGRNSAYVWNNPTGGAAEWNYLSNAFVVDTQGEIRWYINADKLLEYNNIFNTGIMMGFRQNSDGALSWGFGQRYVKYDFMGREIFNRQLPLGYQDFSHSMDNMKNGNYLLRVASSNYKRPDDKNVRTVRDVIIEVDPSGKVVDEWRLFDILDPYRSDVIKVLDQGAVCLNVDEKHAGQTLSAEDLAKMDESSAFGDIAGTGPGRNWVHVNSVDYDANDDSIVISSRHQNAAIKIGRDKEVKWILGAHKGWKGKFKDKLLQPVDSKGNKIVCEDEYTKCPGYMSDKGGFDWTYTQHTAFVIDSKSKKDLTYLAVFDNGDSRGFEQPALASMKYSRGVIYKIDEKKMTVEQIWEYGKNRGSEWYSPITSLTEYQDDKDSIMVYSATAGMQYNLSGGKMIGSPRPEIDEFKWGATEPSVQIQFFGTGSAYQSFPINFQTAFEK